MPRIVRWIWSLLVFNLSLGLIAYIHFLLTGQYSLLTWYFVQVGSLFLLAMTAAEFCLAVICCSWFERDEPMRLAWIMIACAAMARLLGTLMSQTPDGRVLGNPLSWFGLQASWPISSMLTTGRIIGGPLALIFLVAGLWRVLQIKRHFRLLTSLTRMDKALLAVIIAFTAEQCAEIFSLLLHGNHPSPSTLVLWLSDPLLALLLVQAVLIRRSVIRMGQGLVAKCWGMFVVAIVFTSAGDVGLWAAGHSFLPAQMMPIGWYIWFVAEAAFAAAPAYQLAAIWLAEGKSNSWLLAK